MNCSESLLDRIEDSAWNLLVQYLAEIFLERLDSFSSLHGYSLHRSLERGQALRPGCEHTTAKAKHDSKRLRESTRHWAPDTSSAYERPTRRVHTAVCGAFFYPGESGTRNRAAVFSTIVLAAAAAAAAANVDRHEEVAHQPLPDFEAEAAFSGCRCRGSSSTRGRRQTNPPSSGRPDQLLMNCSESLG